jgi:hypothetical protein
MRTSGYFLWVAIICVMTGCSNERIVRLEDTERGLPVPNKTLIFTHGRDSWIPGADVPLFGPAVVTVEVPLDTNGEAHIHLRRVLWWARFEEDQTRTGNCGTSIKPSDLRDGGVYRLYRPPPTIGDTNIFPSKYVLRITKG